ncbi:MAG: septal ring lytic transglycosylase RlpA family protein [Gammaproteobacteria bacterium]
MRRALERYPRGKHRLTVLSGLVLLGGCSVAPVREAAIKDIDVTRIPNAVPRAEPRSRYGNPESYEVFGERYFPIKSSEGYFERGFASWYGPDFHLRRTSSGETYDMYQMTAAHRILPLPTYVEVTNVENGRKAVVRVNDRGPFKDDRVIDLSYTAAKKLGVYARGTALVELRALRPPVRRRKVIRHEAALAAPPASPGPVPETGRGRAAEATPLSAAGTLAQSPVPPQWAPSTARPGPIETRAPSEVSRPALYLQVAAFRDAARAAALRERLLVTVGHTVRIHRGMYADKPVYRVQVGPLRNAGSADQLTVRLAPLGLQRPRLIAN